MVLGGEHRHVEVPGDQPGGKAVGEQSQDGVFRAGQAVRACEGRKDLARAGGAEGDGDVAGPVGRVKWRGVDGEPAAGVTADHGDGRLPGRCVPGASGGVEDDPQDTASAPWTARYGSTG